MSGTIFGDLDHDGAMTGTEVGLVGATVVLVQTSTKEQASTVSLTGGQFTFPSVSAGCYTIRVSGVPGYQNAEVTVTVTNANSTGTIGLDNGWSGVSGQVFHDKDANGVRASGEDGLAGATVTLRSGTTVVDETTTLWDGSYLLPNLTPGAYTVSVTTPTGTLTSTQSVPVTVIPTGTATADLGLYRLASLSGVLFVDTNNNQTFDSGVDKPLANATVKVEGPTTKTVTTGADGKYSITDLPPGTYSVTMTAPAAYEGMLTTMSKSSSLTLTSGMVGDYSGYVITANDVSCKDFTTQPQAQAFFDRTFPLFGDIANLDADKDKKACEELPATRGTTSTAGTTTTAARSTPSSSSSTSSSSTLAHTGADPVGPLALSFGLIGLGGALVRRR